MHNGHFPLDKSFGNFIKKRFPLASSVFVAGANFYVGLGNYASVKSEQFYKVNVADNCILGCCNNGHVLEILFYIRVAGE